MAEVARSRSLPHPPQEVWDRLADLGAIASWAPNVDHSAVVHAGDGPIGRVRRIQTGRRALLERVVRWDEGTELAYVIEGLPKVVRTAENAWRVSARPDGGTDVVLTSTVDCGPRPPQQVVARLVARRLAAESDRLLDGLTHALETSRA